LGFRTKATAGILGRNAWKIARPVRLSHLIQMAAK
jgi:hypothetical protein